MEMADDILATMGVSDATPLSESKQEPVHAVGKSYEEELPEVSDDQRLQFIQESMNTISETEESEPEESEPEEKTEKSNKGTKRQKAARKLSKNVGRLARIKRRFRNPNSPLGPVRHAASHIDKVRQNYIDARDELSTDGEETNGEETLPPPTNPRNKISRTLMSVPGKHQKLKSGARWKKGITRFEAVSYIDNTGHEPTVSKVEVEKMRPLNLKKKKKEPKEEQKVQEEGLNKDINPMVATALKDWNFFSGKKLTEDWRQDAFDAPWNQDDEDEHDEDKDKIEEKSSAWQRKEGKNPEGGLNKKGVASYRAENPGSKLKTAVTTKPSKLKKGSKAASRRKSFCARMSGMKRKRTSSKTANDPNSRINKSLRKWNCNEMVDIALQEMTAVGSLGVNFAGKQFDPEKPYKNKKKKKDKKKKTLDKFIMNAFKK